MCGFALNDPDLCGSEIMARENGSAVMILMLICI